MLFFLFLVIAYAAKEFVINVKNRLITVINVVLKISAEIGHHPSICEVLQTQLLGSASTLFMSDGSLIAIISAYTEAEE